MLKEQSATLNKSISAYKEDNKNPTTKSNTPYSRFLYAISNKETLDYYQRKFRHFLNYLEIDGNDISEQVDNLCKRITQEGKDSDWFRDTLIDYIAYQKSRVSGKEITAGTLRNYYKPIKLFCDMNDILVNWKIVNRGMPSPKRSGQDRTPTIAEIHSMMEFGDPRIKPIVLLMVSSGIRVGAWEYLKWKHVTPLYNQDKILLAAKLIVYVGEPEEYFTFITPEAYNALVKWMDFRKSYGERITGESWLMRDMWRTTDMDYVAKTGMAHEPIQLKAGGVRSLIHRVLFKQNIRPLLEQDQKRHEFKALHGFRKFYKTVCEQLMKPANIELLMGHNLGISQSYYKPTESQLLEDYLKDVNDLTIEKAFRLQQQVIILQKEKEEEITQLKKDQELTVDAYAALSDKVSKLIKEMELLKK
jgi:integrase